MRSVVLALLMLVAAMPVSAQFSEWAFRADDLPKSVESFMGVKTTLNKELKQSVKSFTDNIEKKIIGEEFVMDITVLLNAYEKKRAHPTPHMLNLIKCINAFWLNDKIVQYYEWSRYMQDLMDLEKRNIPLSRLNDIIEFTYHLLSSNSLEFSSSRNWYLSSSNYEIILEEGDPTGDNPDSDIKYMKVKCNNVDLRCKNRTDSTLAIYNTSGVYNANTHEWEGHGGRVDWRRGGLSPDSIYAELGDYKIDTRSAQYSAEDVQFHNVKYFKKPIKGHYEDKVVVNGTGVKARFPEFDSYDADLAIPNLADGIDYVGGYAQHGVLFLGSVKDSAAYCKLDFKYKDRSLIEAKAKSFVFGLQKLEGQNVIVNIKLTDKLGITHPGVKLRYNSATENLVFAKGKTGLENASYIDSYHELDININQIEWHRNDSIIYFATRLASPLDYATFESSHYFTKKRYKALQGMSVINPLVLINDYTTENCSKDFTDKGIQVYLNKTEGTVLSSTQVHQMLIDLSYDGFIEYNVAAHAGSVKQKLWDWLGDNRHARDYDCISMRSDFMKPNGLFDKDMVNATLSLNDNKLSILHVRPFDVSEPRMVKFLPDSAVEVSRGLDMKFRGKIQAGLVDYYGNDFRFSYGDYNVKIAKADSMAVLTENMVDDKGHTRIDSVRSVLESITGVLSIDEPNNKSGYHENLQYPRLVTSDTSYVYYDNLTSEKYDRETFHMTVYPFQLDSMNFIQTNGVKAKGKFISGIFPDLDVTLTVQPDLSLGFVLPTPEEGMDLFSGKGSYHNTVKLNADGLAGAGEIRYLTAVARGEQFQFYPDSVAGIANYVDIKGVKKSEVGTIKDVKAEYASVHSDSALVYWMPERDIFSTESNDTLIKLFNNSVDFCGRVDLTPKEMRADGKMLFSQVGIDSKKYSLRNNSFDADEAVYSNYDSKFTGDTTVHFYTEKYNIKCNFDNNYAQFIVSSDSAYVYFPQHKYKQKTDFFTWNLDKGHYEFGNKLNNYDSKMIASNKAEFEKIRYANSEYKPVLAGATLISNKDTMTYDAQSVSYQNSDKVINVHEPGVIKIVDSKIDPSGIIQVNLGGDISRFENAVITSNFDSLYHKIINTTVKIRDKYYFKAIGGEYQYVDESQKISYLKVDSLEVRKMKTDTTEGAPKKRVSFGIGSVLDEQHFMLSPQYMFVGKFSFQGNTPGIKFNGYSYITQQCDSTVMPFKFEGNLNPDHIIFPISDRVMDTAKVRLYSGFFYNEEQNKLYSIFMGRKIAHRDMPVLAAQKGLSYSVKNVKYEIASAKRLEDPNVNENYFSLSKNTCDVSGEGYINTNINIEPIEVVTNGSITNSRNEKTISLRVAMTVNLPIKQEFMKMMAADIEYVDGLRSVLYTNERIPRNLSFFCGRDSLDAVISAMNIGDNPKFPLSLQKSFVFADVNMTFDTTTHSYRSVGKLGVMKVGDMVYNRYVPGCIEIISNKKKGDQISIYLQPEHGKWYYFNYSAGFLYCLSSEPDWNDKINGLKEKDRVIKLKDSEFQYVIGNEALKNKFARSFVLTTKADDDAEKKRKEELNKKLEQERLEREAAEAAKAAEQSDADDDKSDKKKGKDKSKQDDSEAPAESTKTNDTPPADEAPAQDNSQQQPAQEESDYEEQDYIDN